MIISIIIEMTAGFAVGATSVRFAGLSARAGKQSATGEPPEGLAVGSQGAASGHRVTRQSARTSRQAQPTPAAGSLRGTHQRCSE